MRLWCLMLLPACSFLEGKLATEKVALIDMEEPLALQGEADDEEQRRSLPAGGFSGLYVDDARESLEEMEAEPCGVLVTQVVENSPADAAGLQEGDILLEAGGKTLRWASEWRDLELKAGAGSTLELVFDRAGVDMRARLTVAARIRPTGRKQAERLREEDRVGIVVRTATEVEARRAGLGPGGGAVVVGLSRSSPWRRAGLRFGDLIVEAAGQRVAHPRVILEAIRDAPERGTIKLAFVRDGKRRTLEASVARRMHELRRVSIPLLFSYEKSGGRKTVSLLFGLYRRERTPAAWELRLFYLLKIRGGDADRLEELKK